MEKTGEIKDGVTPEPDAKKAKTASSDKPAAPFDDDLTKRAADRAADRLGRKAE